MFLMKLLFIPNWHTQTIFFQLGAGTLVTVPPSLVKRCKNHFHNLLCGASIILGNNGFIWISPQISDDHQQPQMRFQTPATGKGSVASGPGDQRVGPVARETRETIARLRNCIVALAQVKVLLFDTTIQYTYDASLKYEVMVTSSSQYGCIVLFWC